MDEAGASTEVLAVEMGDPTESQQRMQARLSADASIDGLLTLGPSMVPSALRALQETGKHDQVAMATCDLSPEILQGIEDGRIQFAIDQQQYLQGYLPVIMLSLHLRNHSTFPGEVMRTGPALVTPENVEALQQLSEQGLR
jgi:simple sugar transport system substrate-binding protein